MSKRESALQALEMMQALLSNSSDGEFSDNDEYEAVNVVEAAAELQAESFDFEDEETVVVLPFRSEKNMGSLMTKTNLLTAPMQMHHSPHHKVRMHHFGCWLQHPNVCKVTCKSKT